MLDAQIYRWLLAFCVIFLVVPSISHARETYSTIGRPTCQTWNENLIKSRNRDEMYGWVSLAGNKAWLMGFVSGVNYLADEDLLKNLDSQIIFDWTSKYCEENPENTVIDAVAVLIVKMQEIAKKNRRVTPGKKR